jgi:glyoxylase-like metal-dependent hydrolase (beta-lactamase superfamily II)
MLYDTGYSDHFQRATEPFPERLYRWATPPILPLEQRLEAQLGMRGLRLSDIGWSLISHFHGDHVAGLRDLTKARFLCLQEDLADLRRRGRIDGLRHGLLPTLLPRDFESRLDFAESRPATRLEGVWAAFGPQGHDLFSDGSIVAIALPGHSPRQMGLRLREASGRELLLCADAAWSRRAWENEEWPALPARWVMHDWPSYQRTVRALGALARHQREVMILPSHCEASLAEYRALST